MQKWYQNRYVLAAVVGIIIGVFGGLQQLDLELAKNYPEYARILGAVLIGIALFVDVLPRPQQIVNPTVRIVSDAPLTQAETAAPLTDQEVLSDAPVTIVKVTKRGAEVSAAH